jgi:hypothetical protein
LCDWVSGSTENHHGIGEVIDKLFKAVAIRECGFDLEDVPSAVPSPKDISLGNEWSRQYGSLEKHLLASIGETALRDLDRGFPGVSCDENAGRIERAGKGTDFLSLLHPKPLGFIRGYGVGA